MFVLADEKKLWNVFAISVLSVVGFPFGMISVIL
jgi:hypothetical protein